MNGSTLTYSQIMSVSSNLNSYAREMQSILDEITTLSSKLVMKMFGLVMLQWNQNKNLIQLVLNLLIFIKL